jgi:hypothetical protein
MLHLFFIGMAIAFVLGAGRMATLVKAVNFSTIEKLGATAFMSGAALLLIALFMIYVLPLSS